LDERARLNDRILRLDSRVFQFLQSGQANAWLSVDLTMPQLKVLLIVFGAGSATIGELARGLGVTLPTVTGIVDRLIDHKLVSRAEDPADRRVTRVSIAEDGRALVESLYLASRGRVQRLLDRLDLEALRTIERALDHLYEAVREEALEQGVATDVAAIWPVLGGHAP
jgi:DNA-binding MarR family transcriptional regulator